MVSYDFDRVFVCADRTVGAETPEFTWGCTGRSGVWTFNWIKREICNVVLYADSKSWLFRVLVNGDDLFRSGILWTKSVSSCEYRNIVEFCSLESGNHVEIKRFAQRAGFLCSVEYRNSLDAVRNSFNKLVGNERSVKSYLDKTVLAAVRVEVIYRFFDCIVYRTHSDDYMFCVGRAVIVKELVICTELCVYLAHVFFNNCRHSVIIWIARLSCLEEYIRILCSAS